MASVITQEQLSNLKHFWRLYGKYIISVLGVVVIAYLGSVFWNWNSSSNSGKAAVLYSDFTTATNQGDKNKERIDTLEKELATKIRLFDNYKSNTTVATRIILNKFRC